MWQQHIDRSDSSDAVLFSTSDEPLLNVLGMYREEPEVSFGNRPYPAVPAVLALRQQNK